MKKETLYIIKNLNTGHYYCESKNNFTTNKKYAKTFSKGNADAKQKELKEIFDCEVEELENEQLSD